MAASVVASVTTSVGTAVAASVGGATAGTGVGVAAGGAATGSMSTSAGGGAAGGGILTLLFGVQRFACSASLGVEESELQREVAQSLDWAVGEVPLLTPALAARLVKGRSPFDTDRRLQDDGGDGAWANTRALSPELTALINLILTAALALGLAALLQLALVLVWRHCLNRRYYHKTVRVAPQSACTWGLQTSHQRTKRPPKFFPFPKSLVWPTPLLFASGVFITGLTRASVRVIAACVIQGAWKSNPHTRAGVVVASATLGFVIASIMSMSIGLSIFFCRHGHAIRWQPATKVGTPQEVVDPLMRLFARLMSCCGRRGPTPVVDVKSTTLSHGELELAPMREGLRAWEEDDALDEETSAAPLVASAECTTGRRSVATVVRKFSPMICSPLTPNRRHYYAIDPTPGHAAPLPSSRWTAGHTPSRRTTPLDAVVPTPEPRRPSLAPLCAQTPPTSPPPSPPRASVSPPTSTHCRHYDRKVGAFTLPAEDTAEPVRTERLLSHPFALRRPRPGDAFQAIEGFTLFRVNGTSRVGTLYRLIVVLANATFGVLAGLAPMLPPGSNEAFVQSGAVLVLQLAMAWVCFRFLPDADRIVSLFAGTQFLLEGISTSCLLGATIMRMVSSHGKRDNAMGALDGSGDAAGTWPLWLQLAAFWVGLVALGVPVLQLIEQRCLTPTMLVVRTKGVVQSPLALCATLYMLASTLPRMIHRLAQTAAGLEDVENGAGGNAADGATADAGDDAADEGRTTGGQPGAGVDTGVELSGEAVACATHKVSKLLARGLAAKEAAGADLVRSASSEGDETPQHASRRLQSDANRSSNVMVTGETADDGGDDM